MIIFVGSTNPVKINAVKFAAKDRWPNLEVRGFAVDSLVSDQPMTDQETKQGAVNRAHAVLEQGLSLDLSDVGGNSSKKKSNQKVAQLGIGVEGGITMINDRMWTTVWAALIDTAGHVFQAGGGHFPVPDFVAERILKGEEMGPIMSEYFGGRSVKKQEGLVGVISQKYVDRAELYSAIIRLAIGQWYGRNWRRQLGI